MIVLLNPGANGGRARERWEAVRPELERAALLAGYQVVTAAGELDGPLREGGERVVVAAGGDGTVNAVLESVMRLPPDLRARVVIGGIGLGSSNDFHKPLDPSRCVAGVPVRVDAGRPVAHDVGRIELDDGSGAWRTCHFLLNASVGIVAAGNDRFNRPGRLLRSLKRRSVPAAIWCAALHAIVATPDLDARIELDGELSRTDLTNASFLIEPHFTGSLWYDLPLRANAGKLAVALAERMGVVARARTLAALARGRFVGLPGTRVAWVERASVALDRQAPVEFDGEVLLAQAFRVALLGRAVSLCT
jgi:diacylglycerol kinase (ATP)